MFWNYRLGATATREPIQKHRSRRLVYLSTAHMLDVCNTAVRIDSADTTAFVLEAFNLQETYSRITDLPKEQEKDPEREQDPSPRTRAHAGSSSR